MPSAPSTTSPSSAPARPGPRPPSPPPTRCATSSSWTPPHQPAQGAGLLEQERRAAGRARLPGITGPRFARALREWMDGPAGAPRHHRRAPAAGRHRAPPRLRPPPHRVAPAGERAPAGHLFHLETSVSPLRGRRRVEQRDLPGPRRRRRLRVRRPVAGHRGRRSRPAPLPALPHRLPLRRQPQGLARLHPLRRPPPRGRAPGRRSPPATSPGTSSAAPRTSRTRCTILTNGQPARHVPQRSRRSSTRATSQIVEERVVAHIGKAHRSPRPPPRGRPRAVLRRLLSWTYGLHAQHGLPPAGRRLAPPARRGRARSYVDEDGQVLDESGAARSPVSSPPATSSPTSATSSPPPSGSARTPASPPPT